MRSRWRLRIDIVGRVVVDVPTWAGGRPVQRASQAVDAPALVGRAVVVDRAAGLDRNGNSRVAENPAALYCRGVAIDLAVGRESTNGNQRQAYVHPSTGAHLRYTKFMTSAQQRDVLEAMPATVSAEADNKERIVWWIRVGLHSNIRDIGLHAEIEAKRTAQSDCSLATTL